MSINIDGYSQAKTEIVTTFAHGYDIVCMQDTNIGPEHCRKYIHGMKLIAETRHRKYGSTVYAKPTLNIEEVHTEVTDSQIELITVTVSLAKITITSVYKPPATLAVSTMPYTGWNQSDSGYRGLDEENCLLRG